MSVIYTVCVYCAYAFNMQLHLWVSVDAVHHDCFMADYARVCPLDVCERNMGHAAGSSGGL